jgi:Spy/CpxP family protein refolding chaperone
MWKLAALICAIALAACASAPPSPSAAEQWSSYRTQVVAQRDQGRLTATQAEDKMRRKFEQFFGADPTMEGALAYERDLYVAADAGKLPRAEAEALSDARIDEVMQRRAAQQALQDSMEKRFPRDPED